MSPPRSVPVIGLIGGIGSGKSSIARWLAGRQHVVVIDADAIGHDVLQTPEIKRQLGKTFGNKIFDADGRVVHKALAELVFGQTSDQRRARRQLEQIVHPEIGRIIAETIAQVRASQAAEAVVLEAAVLLESGWSNLCDAVVFVDAPVEDRQRRTARARGWSAEQLRRRENSQLDLNEKRRRADYVICNHDSLERAGLELEKIVNQWTRSDVEQFDRSGRQGTV